MKKIPKKYMCKGTYETGGCRSISPYGKELLKLGVEELCCPSCNSKSLRLGTYDGYLDIPDYRVTCDNCDWDCPVSLSDCGEAISECKTWLEAFNLMGSPKELLNEDLTLYFYPDEWREKLLLEKVSVNGG